MPVFSCMASRFGDAGVDELFSAMMERISPHSELEWIIETAPVRAPDMATIIPTKRQRYLSDLADGIRTYKANARAKRKIAAKADGLHRAMNALGAEVPPMAGEFKGPSDGDDAALIRVGHLYNETIAELSDEERRLLAQVPELRTNYGAEKYSYTVRGREIEVNNYTETLSGTQVPKVALPRFEDWGELLEWRLLENVPGEFPFTAGVFPYKRTGEDPTRMFAGEGHPERTNRRFHYVSLGQPAARLSTAFDSVTLYGRDPAVRPDVYGKVGNSGVMLQPSMTPNAFTLASI